MATEMIPAAIFAIKPTEVVLWIVVLVIIALLLMRRKARKVKS